MADTQSAAQSPSDQKDLAQAETLKNDANEFFQSGKYDKAVETYSKAIELNGNSAIYYSNRSFAYSRLEQYGAAVTDATKAIDLDKTYLKAYYRRGSANLALGKYKEALKDFRKVAQIYPRNKEALEKLKQCEKIVRQMAFQDAITVEEDEYHVSQSSSSSSASFANVVPGLQIPLHSLFSEIKLDEIDVEPDYDGPHLPAASITAANEIVGIALNSSSRTNSTTPSSSVADDNSTNVNADDAPVLITLEFVSQLIEHFKKQKKLHLKYVYAILLQMRQVLMKLDSLITIDVPEGTHFTVCGDVHGQFYDFLNIFAINGLPSETNPYLFNGDFVDRGSFSMEIILTLFALKLLYPKHLHLLRGNHETLSMNRMYGFEGEAVSKYNRRIFELFTEVFCWLPLSACLGNKVLVVHGGLFSRDNVSLNDIRAIDRHRQPPDEGLMCELLWSDPSPFPGRTPNKRGVGVAFGPDVTHNFLQYNNLQLVVRSHEVKEEGYLIEADGKLVTVFSAPNYCDQVGNKGAFIRFDSEMKPNYVQFSAVPHPAIKPMAYASNFSMFF
jgi:serine/threonine-protein phosphatase 5